MTTTQVCATAQSATLSGTTDELINFRDVQTITLTDESGNPDAGDSFNISYNNSAVTSVVVGTNCTAAALQTALRTATGDTSLTVAGTTDVGPFTVTFVGLLGHRPLLNVFSVSGMTSVVVTQAKPQKAYTLVVTNRGTSTTLSCNINSATVPTALADDTFSVPAGTTLSVTPGGEIYNCRVVGNGEGYTVAVF